MILFFLLHSHVFIEPHLMYQLIETGSDSLSCLSTGSKMVAAWCKFSKLLNIFHNVIINIDEALINSLHTLIDDIFRKS